jgi:hypothetical protein
VVCVDGIVAADALPASGKPWSDSELQANSCSVVPFARTLPLPSITEDHWVAVVVGGICGR